MPLFLTLRTGMLEVYTIMAREIVSRYVLAPLSKQSPGPWENDYSVIKAKAVSPLGLVLATQELRVTPCTNQSPISKTR